MTIGESLPGGFAEYVAIPASTVLGGEVIHVPKTVSYDVATLVEPLACVLNGLDMAGFRPGETILVIGLGAIGCLHILAARARGAGLIIGADVSGRRIELARVCGADEYVNSKERDLSSAVKSQTGGLGVDVVVVACGAAEAQIQALGLVAKGGRVCFFGGLPTHASKIAIDSNRIHYDELTICGAYGARAHHYHNAMTMIASGHWPFEQLITHRVPLECINEGFRKAQMAESLRVIVVPGDDHAP
jgi:L-iditol 2-dehydrogenase